MEITLTLLKVTYLILGEYKERLREKIHQKLLDIRMTHKDCLDNVSDYLSKDII